MQVNDIRRLAKLLAGQADHLITIAVMASSIGSKVVLLYIFSAQEIHQLVSSYVRWYKRTIHGWVAVPRAADGLRRLWQRRRARPDMVAYNKRICSQARGLSDTLSVTADSLLIFRRRHAMESSKFGENKGRSRSSICLLPISQTDHDGALKAATHDMSAFYSCSRSRCMQGRRKRQLAATAFGP